MQIKIDGKICEFESGKTVLEVCRQNGIFIPSLCYQSDFEPEGICRLCMVKVKSKNSQKQSLTTSCTLLAEDMAEVTTEDDDVYKAWKINLELLWADHVGKCFTCIRNGNCELQNLAKKFKIDVRDFIPSINNFNKEEQLRELKESLKNRVVDDKNSSIYRDNQYCVECRRCVKVCKQFQTVEAYGMNYRSIKTRVGTPLEEPLDCIFCGQCSLFCPTAAITEKDETGKLEEILKDKTKLKIFQVAPSVRFTLGEEFGLAAGSFVEKKIPSALLAIGADLVFDTTFSADLTIIEEANELAERLLGFLSGNKEVKLPMFTSCCPAWVLYVEKFWPQFLPHLSSAKSPQQMMGAVIKTFYAQKKKVNLKNLVNISIMPCTAKKFEAARKEMGRDGFLDVDLAITTRELARYLKNQKIDIKQLPDGEFNRTLGAYSGAGVIFGSTGGVMEAALRTAYEKLTCEILPKVEFHQVRGFDGLREAEIVIPKGKCVTKEIKVKVAVAHQIKNAKLILEKLAKNKCDYHFVEVMACPNGCLGGGGQPIPTNEEIRRKRAQAIYARDAQLPIRKSHENFEIKKLYEEYFEFPGSEKAEKYLHTKFTPRINGK